MMSLSKTEDEDSTGELTDLENIESESEFTDDVFEKYVPYAEKAVSLDDTFVLAMSSQASGDSLKVATGLSNNTCEILQASNASITNTVTLKNAHTQVLTGVHLNSDQQICYTSSLDGYIKVWDLRATDKPVMQCTDDSDVSGRSPVKPITCFDISSNNLILCGGTEEVDDDSYLLFWDIRTGNTLGGYWESHTCDITQVRFHPTSPSTLMSGSTDGLINIFDVNKPDEHEALQECLNTEDSVEKLCWLRESSLSCITLTAQIQMWNLEETCPSSVFRRKQIAQHAQMKSSASCYLINTHRYQNKTILLTGSNYGKADCLRSLKISQSGKATLSHHGQFIGNKQIVRCSTVHDEANLFLTGGEAGIISVWKPSQNSNPDDRHRSTRISKSKSSLRINSTKPYTT